jgi:hypothetical protein
MHTGVNTMRKTIYIKDEATWGSIKAVAKEKGMSVSGLVSSLTGPIDELGDTQLDRIEKKLDLVLQKNFKAGPIDSDFIGGRSRKSIIDSGESEILAEGQKKLEAVKAQQKIQTPKGAVKANKAMSDFISYSKDRQLGKRGAK